MHVLVKFEDGSIKIVNQNGIKAPTKVGSYVYPQPLLDRHRDVMGSRIEGLKYVYKISVLEV